MAWRHGRKRTGDAEGFDFRVRPQDRIGGPPKGAATEAAARTMSRLPGHKRQSPAAADAAKAVPAPAA